MSDLPNPSELEVRPARRSFLSRISFVWLVPLIALVISLFVAWQNYSQRGTLIEIRFDSASGISAGETEIRYRDVTVGRVEAVKFDEGLTDVVISARIDNAVAPYLDDDAEFWVVQPDVSLRGVTGLETVLSGVFIEGRWDTEADVAQTQFQGLEEAPVIRDQTPGTQITLRARTADALSEGAPVLHKGIPVGYIDRPELGPDGETVIATAFIEFPYDRRITDQTRFWETSALSLSVGTGGVSLDISSIASLLEGGIAFDTVVSGGEPVDDDAIFDIFADEITASESLFADPDQPTYDVAVLFDGTVAGLRKGSEVRFKGIRVGQVKDITAVVIEGDDPDDVKVDLRAVLGIEPGRMGMAEGATDAEVGEFLASFVANGLRARLATGNILSGALTVELLQVENAGAAAFDITQEPYPLLPTTDNVITDVADTAEGVLQRIQDLPIEEVLQSGIDLMDSLDALARSEEVRTAPASLVGLVEDVRALVASEDVQAIPGDVRGVIGGLGDIVLSAEEAQLIAQLNTALATANGALANVAEGTTNLPAIAAEVEEVLALVSDLQVQALLTQTGDTLDAIEILMRGEDMQALPGTVNALLNEGQSTLAEARALVASDDVQAIPGDVRGVIAGANRIVLSAEEAELIGQLNTTLAAAASAAENVAAGTENLPALTAQAEALIAKLNALEVESLLAQTDDTLDAVEVLLRGEDMQALPGTLNALLDQGNGTLAEARRILATEDMQALPTELRAILVDLKGIVSDIAEADIAAQITGAITNANTAIDNVTEATDGLPAIAEQIGELTATASELELQALIDQTSATLNSIETLMNQDATRALPGSVAGALDELRLLINEVNEGGAIANVNAALASANEAAQAIETAAASLPQLSNRATSLVGSTQAVIDGYGERSRFNAETLATLRDVQEAADAISALARTIQRNPSSLLTGR